MASTYTVKKGDTLWGIAEAHLGSGSRYPELAALNGIVNPDLIYVGQVIKLEADGSGSSGSSSNTQQVTIKQFGLQADVDNVLFVTWDWPSHSNTEHYQVRWEYYTANKIWFPGSDTTVTDKFSTYNIPSNAKQVRVRIKPISKKKGETNKTYFTASWTSWKKHTVANPPDTPPVPTVTLDNLKLTAEVANVTDDPSIIEFEIAKDDATVYKTGKVAVATASASYSSAVVAGSKYKVRCRSYKDGLYSEWSNYSSNVDTIPATPSKFAKCEPKSLSDPAAIYLEWSKITNATSYEIQYATSKSYFDTSDQVYSKTGITATSFEVTSNIVKEKEYFFRLRATNDKGSSGWSEISSTIIGSGPAAPTTWSSTTTAVVGEPLNLYWVHNSEDNSVQKYAELEILVNDIKTYKVTSHTDGTEETYTVKNLVTGNEKTFTIKYETAEDAEKTKTYSIDTTEFSEGVKIEWRVRTAGISNTYGDYSINRTIIIYAPPTLELHVTDISGNSFDVLESLPFKVSALAGPNTQRPTGYYLTITSNDMYETVDELGNTKTVSAGEQVFAKHFDISEPLDTQISAGDISLENDVEYTITCTASMNSGLTAEASVDFTVNWTETNYTPNAEISIDEDTFVAYIKPYCASYKVTRYKVNMMNSVYITTTEIIGDVYGYALAGATTTNGEQVYYGVTPTGSTIYYYEVVEMVTIDDVLLSVYRREFDGSFTELMTGIDGAKQTTITDPHPSLDFARYRVVATSKSTGAVTYYDLPGYPINGKSAIIQWDEQWSTFDVEGDEDDMVQPPWIGSLLQLPYNIDVSDSYDIDVELVKYIGRDNPVSYYGTQRGETSNWSVEIPKTDKDTLYAIRRLSVWKGDVYVREPSGTGYWANVKVTYSQKHCETTIPVTISITRVEGGA